MGNCLAISFELVIEIIFMLKLSSAVYAAQVNIKKLLMYISKRGHSTSSQLDIIFLGSYSCWLCRFLCEKWKIRLANQTVLFQHLLEFTHQWKQEVNAEEERIVSFLRVACVNFRKNVDRRKIIIYLEKRKG